MIKNFSAAIFFLLAPALILTAEELYDLKKSQSATINKIISNEKSESRKKELVDIINYIDTTYGELHEKLARGEKITIYFGPAHGKDHTGEWRGITTNRIGVTGLPEEYYSIKYSRKLYDLLKKNRFIEIAAKPEYRSVLEGKSDSYHYMKFRDVMRNARASNSFMVIEMHMNNVAIFNKADGLVNMPGIHMARDSNGRKMIVNIKSTNSGFLTLYNKFDASDFSRQYAVNIRQSLVKKGYIPNGWEYGAVADDRFTYYLNFPISLIYECGFISDPEEEKKLLDEDYMDGMIKSQYEMLLKTFNDMFGVDISGNELKITEKDYSDNIELLKLARIAIFYIQNAETDQANIAVRAMKKNYYHGANKGVIDYYSSIMNKINNSERHYHKGSRYNKRKKYSRARKSFIYAKNNLNRNEIYSAYRHKYNAAIYGNRKRYYNDNISQVTTKDSYYRKQKDILNESSVVAVKSRLNKPFILIIRKNQTLDDAVTDALSPDSKDLSVITGSMKNFYVHSYKKVKKYSKKKKRYVRVWKKSSSKFTFDYGIYIVTLDKNRRVVKAERVSSVYLNPERYQNQQYLKNSYFAETERQKDF